MSRFDLSRCAVCLVLLVASGCTKTELANPASGDPTPGDDRAGDPSGDAAAGDPLPPSDPASGDPACPSSPVFDYRCSANDPATCPGGTCVLGSCFAPVLDPDRWANCDDGECDRCESAAACPADCAQPPVLVGAKSYADPETLTVYLHGFFSVKADDWPTRVYGASRGSGNVGAIIQALFPDVADGTLDPTNPRQVVGMEYYGGTPSPDFTTDEVTAIEAFDPSTPDTLERYARIVATFIEHRLALCGAHAVNIYCHSMGCHITRFILEHDLGGLASHNLISRWSTISAPIGGAALARLYDNPQLQAAAPLLGLNTIDFVHMHPDYVTDHVAIWDHRPLDADNPLLSGILIHNIAGTDPNLAALGDHAGLVSIAFPGNLEPNDGILFTSDSYFHGQDAAVRFVTPSGEALSPSVSTLAEDHLTAPNSDGAAVMTAAATYGARKVYVSISSVTLLDDHERDSPLDFSDLGDPPAELAVEAEVQFDPYVAATLGRSVVAHGQYLSDSNLPIAVVTQGETLTIDYPVYSGPVLDQMDALQLTLAILEVDWYPRLGVTEDVLNPAAHILDFEGSVPLVDAEIPLTSDSILATLAVHVVTLY